MAEPQETKALGTALEGNVHTRPLLLPNISSGFFFPNNRWASEAAPEKVRAKI